MIPDLATRSNRRLRFSQSGPKAGSISSDGTRETVASSGFRGRLGLHGYVQGPRCANEEDPCSVCTYIPTGSDSVSGCSDWPEDPNARGNSASIRGYRRGPSTVGLPHRESQRRDSGKAVGRIGFQVSFREHRCEHRGLRSGGRRPRSGARGLRLPEGLRRPEQGSGGFPDRGTPEVGGPVLHEGLQRQHSGPGAVRECPSGHLPHNPRGIMDHRGQRRSFGRYTELNSGGGPQVSCPGEDEHLRRSQNDRARD